MTQYKKQYTHLFICSKIWIKSKLQPMFRLSRNWNLNKVPPIKL